MMTTVVLYCDFGFVPPRFDGSDFSRKFSTLLAYSLLNWRLFARLYIDVRKAGAGWSDILRLPSIPLRLGCVTNLFGTAFLRWTPFLSLLTRFLWLG